MKLADSIPSTFSNAGPAPSSFGVSASFCAGAFVSLNGSLKFGWLDPETPTLIIQLSDSAFQNLTSSIADIPKPSNIALLKAVREMLQDKSAVISGGYKDKIRDLGSSISGADVELANRVFGAALSFLRQGNRPILLSSSLYIMVTNELSDLINGEPIEAKQLKLVQDKFVAACTKGPGKGHEQRWDKLLHRASVELEIFKNALGMHHHGHTSKWICKELSIQRQRLNAWLAGEMPLALLDLEEATRNAPKKARILHYPLTPDPFSCAALAAYLSVSDNGCANGQVLVTSAHQGKIQEVAEVFRSVFPTQTVNIFERRNGSTNRAWMCRIISPTLSRNLQEVTNGATELPWPILETAEEKLSFLKMFFKLRSGFTEGKCAFSSKRFSFLTGVGTLLAEFGIVTNPTVKGDGSMLMEITCPFSLSQCIKLGIFEQADAAKLGSISPSEAAFSAEMAYQRVLQYRASHPSASFRSIGQACEVPEGTCYRWLALKGKPRQVKAKEQLAYFQGICSTPDPNLPALLFRHHGLPWKEAVEIGRILTFKEAKALLPEGSQFGSGQAIRERVQKLRRAVA